MTNPQAMAVMKSPLPVLLADFKASLGWDLRAPVEPWILHTAGVYCMAVGRPDFAFRFFYFTTKSPLNYV